MKSEILLQLEQLAFRKSEAFCYSCYKPVMTSHCPTCGSDDFARMLIGVGVDFGTERIIQHILETELTPANLEEAFEESVRDCYPEETTAGWMTFDTLTLMKEQDPISWRCALAEYESQEESEENIISFDNGTTYYTTGDVLDLIARSLPEADD